MTNGKPKSTASIAGHTIISLSTVALLVFNDWKGWDMVYRDHVGGGGLPESVMRSGAATSPQS